MAYNKAVMLLKHYHPLVFPTVVKKEKVKEDDLYGSCEVKVRMDSTYIKIVINKDIDEIAQIDALIHEWAHGRLAGIPEEFESHGPLWGVMFAECYLTVYPD